MSGPKTSRYVLTMEQRRRLEKQQRMIMETNIALERNINIKQKCKKLMDELEVVMDELEDISKESGYEEKAFKFLLQRKKEITEILSQNVLYDDLKSIRSNNSKLKKVLQEIWSLINKGKKSIDNAYLAYKNELDEAIIRGLNLSFSELGKDRKMKGNSFENKINDSFQKIENIMLSAELNEKYFELRAKVQKIENTDFIENFYNLQIYPFVQECEFYRDHIEEFEIMLIQYKKLAMEVGEPVRNFVFSDNNLFKLEGEIERLDRYVMQKKEQEYISQIVDEVMLEMGYELVGERSVTKKSGVKFRNELYTLETGTAVNVTFSDSGQISMELGALDMKDRIPLDEEAIALAEDMRAFCADYAEFEKKIAMKGIVSKRISDLPPLVEYAQVFNTQDYELKRPIEIYKKEKRKANIVKHQHSEG